MKNNQTKNCLFTIPAARFKLVFIAEKKYQFYGKEPVIRSKIGYNLKRVCCNYQDFNIRSCDNCELITNCMYIKLFSPVYKKTLDNDKESQIKTSIRPFVIALKTMDKFYNMNKDDKGIIYFTFFGPAIKNFGYYFESIHALESLFPINIISLERLIPDIDNALIDENQTAWPLNNWSLKYFNKTIQNVNIHFMTPVSFKMKNKITKNNITYTLIIKSIIRRLRDLKRVFDNDDNMGNIDSIIEESNKIQVITNNLHWSKRKRYSFYQDQDVFLNGFSGNISFYGNIAESLPYLKAAEIINIGKSTSAGNGRIICDI